MMEIRSSMSGNLWKIHVATGDKVEAGDEVAILESMKMEIPIISEYVGVVQEICKSEGEFVQEDEIVIKIEP